jgi:hypothetical protein
MSVHAARVRSVNEPHTLRPPPHAKYEHPRQDRAGDKQSGIKHGVLSLYLQMAVALAESPLIWPSWDSIAVVAFDDVARMLAGYIAKTLRILRLRVSGSVRLG